MFEGWGPPKCSGRCARPREASNAVDGRSADADADGWSAWHICSAERERSLVCFARSSALESVRARLPPPLLPLASGSRTLGRSGRREASYGSAAVRGRVALGDDERIERGMSSAEAIGWTQTDSERLRWRL